MGLTSTVALTAGGLKAAQRATEIVANNISSASVDGYTSKTAVVSGIYSENGIVGFRAEITRAFDQEVYDQLIGATGTTSYLGVRSDYLTQIDSLMGTTVNGATLSTALATFSADLQTLAAQPDDDSAQIVAANSGAALVQTLRATATSVQEIAAGVEADIGDAVVKVNTLLGKIADLNAQVASSSAQGFDTTGLLDETDKAVLELSSYLDVQTVRAANGTVRVSTGEALTLVDNARETQFARNREGQLIVANDGNGELDVIEAGLITSGSIAGLYSVRDTMLPQVQSQLDQFAATLARTFSDTTTAGTAATVGAATGFSVDLAGLQSGNTVDLTWKDGATGASHTVTFVKVSDPTALPLDGSATFDPNDTVVGIDFSGGTASVVSQIQAALGSAFAVTNPSGTTLRIVDDGAAATVDVTALSTTTTATTTQSGSTAMPLFTDNGGAFTGSFDGGSQLDGFATRIRLNSAVAGDPSLLVRYSSTTEAADATRVDQMIDRLADGTSWVSLGGGLTSMKKTLADYSTSMVAHWAAQSDSADTDLNNQEVVQATLQSSMSDISSVGTDSELAKLIQLQSMYSANAQVLSTLRDMLDRLYNSM